MPGAERSSPHEPAVAHMGKEMKSLESPSKRLICMHLYCGYSGILSRCPYERMMIKANAAAQMSLPGLTDVCLAGIVRNLEFGVASESGV
jgi:hypothetical protein